MGRMRAGFLVLALAAAGAGCQSSTVATDTSIALPPSALAETKAATSAEGIDTQTAVGSIKKAASRDSIEAYVPPQTGSVFTWRNNWATLPPVVSYRVDGVVSGGEQKYVKMTAVSGLKEKISAFYETTGFGLKGYRDAKDKAVVTFKPVEERYRFPMKPGDKWVTKWESYDHRKKSETSGGGLVEVLRFEKLKLPAGEFDTVKVKLPTPPDMPAGLTHFIWFAPQLGVTVKEQISNGSMNWTQVLEKVSLPAS